MLPDAELAQRTEWEPRLASWESRLRDERVTFVASDDDDGVIVGFCSATPMRKAVHQFKPLLYDSYLASFYVALEAQGRGIGRALLTATANELVAGGSRSLAFHVLATNPARAFYERMGAVLVRNEPAGANESWHSCAYAFTDLRRLAAP